MKKFLKFSIFSILVVSMSLVIYKYSNRYDIEIEKDGIKSDLLIKGLEGASSICSGDGDELFVAFKNEIININSNNQINKVYKDVNLDIEDIMYKDGSLYVISKDKLLLFNDNNSNGKVILDNIPFEGENLDRKLLDNKESILISIGASTNSGIAERGKPYDTYPIDLILNGNNFGSGETGGFKPYGDSSREDEKIEGKKIANASIISVDRNTHKVSLFSSGIRNVKGYDLNSKGEVIAEIGGMTSSGTRGVIRDFDYIYKITKGIWYGWPDFSGGDPITSPRFSDGEKIKPIIKNQPEKKTPTPMYQHKSVNSLDGLVVDKTGNILEKDAIIFYDNKEKVLYSLDNKKVLSKIVTFGDETNIEDMIISNDKCLLLDSDKGYIYRIFKEDKILGDKIPYSVIIITSIIILLGVAILVYKIKANKK